MEKFNKIYEEIIDNLDDYIYIVNNDTFEVIYINDNMLKLIDINEKNDIYNKKCYELIYNLDNKCETCKDLCKNNKEVGYFEVYSKKFDMYLSIKNQIMAIDNQNYRVEIAKNITESQKMINEIAKQYNEQVVLNECVETLIINKDNDSAIKSLLSLLMSFFKADRAFIFESDHNTNLAKNTYEVCSDSIKEHSHLWQNFDLNQYPSWLTRFLNNEYVYTDIETSRNFKEKQILVDTGVSCSLMAPLITEDNHLIGFVGVDEPRINIEATKVLMSICRFIIDGLHKKEMLNNLHQLSYYDALTGLKNRHSYNLSINDYETNTPNTLGVIYISIKGLKNINETLGYRKGDDTIIKLCEIIMNIFDDSCYRIDGNEFVILDIYSNEELFEDKIVILKNDAKKHNIKISIGYTFNRNYKSTKRFNLIDNKNNKSYSEKQQLKSEKYNSILSLNLKKEIENDRFVVYLQPQFELETLKLCGAEALIRKTDSKGNIIFPLDFIPFYEKEGIIGAIDKFVFVKVCELIKKWEYYNLGNDMKIAINFSRVTINEKGLVKYLKKICEDLNVDPSYIMIEITETSGAIDEYTLSLIIKEFKENGFNFSLDDFGVGFSNLSTIATAEFCELKIDKSLINDISRSHKSKILAKSAIDLCNNLSNIESLAEGIETKEQLSTLKELKCTKGQGYFFDKPLAIDAFTKKYIIK